MKKEVKNHPITSWEVSIMEIEFPEGKKFKVSRRLPEMHVAETIFFDKKEDAVQLFNK